MQRAVDLGRLLVPHALKAFNLLDEPPVMNDARYLLEWIRREGHGTFSTRDAQRRNQKRFEAKKARDSLRLLEERGYLAEDSGADARSQTWIVNPLVLK